MGATPAILLKLAYDRAPLSLSQEYRKLTQSKLFRTQEMCQNGHIVSDMFSFDFGFKTRGRIDGMKISTFKSWGIVLGIFIPLLCLDLYFRAKDRMPPAPLDITWRTSALNGLVMHVHNIGGNHLSGLMSVANLTLHQNQQYAFTLNPYAQQDIGIMECSWAFQHGEFGNIKVEGFAEKEFTVP